MSKTLPTVGTDGLPLPTMPPERDPRLWTRLVRVVFFTPGFLALLLLKAGEPAAFGVTVELFMLACGTGIVAGLFIAGQTSGAGSDPSSQTALWCGGLIMELLAVVPFLCALPPFFHQLANSRLLHALAPGAADVSLGASELIPAVAILPFLLYQLCGYGTLSYVVSKSTNWSINIGIVVLIAASYVSNRTGAYGWEQVFGGMLIAMMAITVFYGVLKLKRMQEDFDARCPAKAPKPPKEARQDDGSR